MFDIGFLELCIIGIVALLVIGPDRLPAAARSAGRWVGKARRMVSSLQSEIENELKLNELQEFKKSQGLEEIDKLIKDTKKNLDTGDLSSAPGVNSAETIAIKSTPDTEKDHG